MAKSDSVTLGRQRIQDDVTANVDQFEGDDVTANVDDAADDVDVDVDDGGGRKRFRFSSRSRAPRARTGSRARLFRD